MKASALQIGTVGGSYITDLREDTLKTQKAKGVRALCADSYNILPGVYPPRRVSLVPQNNLTQVDWRHGKWFGRPCPTVPRHGFVESRQVQSLEDVASLFDEARSVDANAEVLLQPKLSGEFSGIATSAGVTWGPGNAGVTSGKGGKTVLIPVHGTSQQHWAGGIGIADVNAINNINFHFLAPTAGYLELVNDSANGHMTAVQWRDGPEQPTTFDYIPHSMSVAEVITTEGKDLLAWERYIASKARSQIGLVMHWNGPLSSHYAVHAIALGVPVITTFRPTIGQIIKPTVSLPPQLNHYDLQHIGHNIDKWMRMEHGLSDHLPAIATTVATIHAQSYWDNTPHLIEFRGMAMATLLKAITAACMGEIRHWYGTGPGSRIDHPAPKTSQLVFDDEDTGRSRSSIYYDVFAETSIRFFLTSLQDTVADFSSKGWRHGRNTDRDARVFSYGGPAWAEVAKAGVRLAECISIFQAAPTQDRWKALSVAANNAVHVAHNGGAVLVKWLNTEAMTRIANAPSVGFSNAFAAKLALGL